MRSMQPSVCILLNRVLNGFSWSFMSMLWISMRCCMYGHQQFFHPAFLSKMSRFLGSINSEECIMFMLLSLIGSCSNI